MKLTIEFDSNDNRVNTKLIAAIIQVMDQEGVAFLGASIQDSIKPELQVPDFVRTRSAASGTRRRRAI